MNSLKSIINQYHRVNKNFISMPKATIFEELPTTKNKVFGLILIWFKLNLCC